ncbi:MAG: adenosylcobinamide-GDP ribazoletransferase [Pseudomonadota bacterium]
MSSFQSSAAIWLNDLRLAASFYTRLPLAPTQKDTSADGDNQSLARALRLGGVIGAAIGSLGGGLYALLFWVGVAPILAALIVLGALIALTGALHEDGLADLADGLGGGWTKERKLQIMRDSRIGAFGTIALILSVGLRCIAIAQIAAPAQVLIALICANGLSRAWLPSVMGTLPLAAADGLAASADKPTTSHIAQAIGIAIILVLLCLPIDWGLFLLLGAGLGVWLVALLAKRQIGGYSGDVLGAAQQTAEIAVLILLATWWE